MNKYSNFFCFLLFSTLFFSSVDADDCQLLEASTSTENHQLINQFSFGPEVYWVDREKFATKPLVSKAQSNLPPSEPEPPKGSKLSGTMAGIRFGYDRIKRYGWYIGADAFYAVGELEGKTKKGNKIRSDSEDSSYEGRFGFTLQRKSGNNFYITPFIGYGYYLEKTNFISPTPLHIHYKNTFKYIPIGFLSHFYVDYLNSSLGVGINFTARYLTSSKVKVTNDPKYPNSTQHYTEEIQYRVELPITYDLNFRNRLWQLRLEPFYEYRNYGAFFGKFDFAETSVKNYGANLQLIYLF